MNRLSPEGIAFLVDYEKAIPKAYKDSAGKWTIGIGHLITEEEQDSGLVEIAGYDHVKWRKTELNNAQMDALFRQDIAPRERWLSDSLFPQPKQHEFDAMFCLMYNIGMAGFARSSVRRLFNAGRLPEAGDAFLLWNKAGGKVSAGLKKRRQQERAMFLHGNYDSTH
jgi:lysozyme